MIRLVRILLIAVLTGLLSASCADDSRFVVRGSVEGAPNMNLRFAYNSPAGFRSGVVAVRDGKFEFAGVSPQQTLVEMYEHDFTPLGRLCLVNGDVVECTLTRGRHSAIKVSGSEINGRWATFLNANSEAFEGDRKGADSLLAEYVGAHPDDLLSSLLMITEYDVRSNPQAADSLFALIEPAARPDFIAGGFAYLLGRVAPDGSQAPLDSISFISDKNRVESFAPKEHRATVLLFTDDAERQRGDSLVKALVRLSGKKDVAVADIYLSPDTMAWRRMIREEKVAGVEAAWQRAWLPGSLGAPQLRNLGIGSLPFAIVCDSAGNQLYRGSHISEVEQAVADILR